ncbi:glycine dehydrogenase [Dendrothele bispora CBS 962.96]|uniref:Glycine cleavage system H protein n=1 Tax=Dendrothele bispora (strain CBS 962.96) TaxID=1314807 RepID=A0A4S8MPM8_DENBC|nr:glycine dehydrogenase [Dendrothele bispora CBS 962.96]
MQTALRRISFLPSRAIPRGSIQAVGALRRPVLSRTIVTKRYTEEHEWVSFDDSNGIGTVSITNHAQSALGDVVFVELPAVGTEVAQGDQMGAVESVKAASDIYAPVSGTIEAVNEALSSQPSLLNKSPESEGWLCKIKLSEPSEVDKLLTEEQYKEHCEQ